MKILSVGPFNQWMDPARPLDGNINSNDNEGALNISQDGQWLIFTGCNFQNGFGSCDLYISYLTTDGWSAPENLGPNFNSEFWESAPSLSPDKRDLYFTSNRPGGFGGNDIYVCHRMENGRWSPPQNLGSSINTAGDESFPLFTPITAHCILLRMNCRDTEELIFLLCAKSDRRMGNSRKPGISNKDD
jgi:Tol biopolymer transport system component